MVSGTNLHNDESYCLSVRFRIFIFPQRLEMYYRGTDGLFLPAQQSFTHHTGAVHQPQPSSTPTGNQPPPQHSAPSPGQVSYPYTTTGIYNTSSFKRSSNSDLFMISNILCSVPVERPGRPAATVFVPLRSSVSSQPPQHAARPHVTTGLVPHAGLQHPQPPGHPTLIPPGAVDTGMGITAHCWHSLFYFTIFNWSFILTSTCHSPGRPSLPGPRTERHVRSPPLGEPRSAPDSDAAAASAGPRLSAAAPTARTSARSTPALLHRTSTRYETQQNPDPGLTLFKV